MELKPRKISRTEPKNSPTMVPNPIFKAPSSEISSNSFNNSANGAPSPNKPAASMDGDGGSSGGCSPVEPKTDNLEDQDKKKNKNKEDDLRAYFNSFPPGYRFCPQDEELLVCYLRKRVNNELLPPNQINEVELYKYNPDELAEKYREFGEKEWYFFTPRDRKYQNGGRPKRSAGKGYWKATGADKPIKVHGNIVGFRKALVFYKGKPPKGEKTNWIMHEYRVSDPPPAPSKNKDSSKSMRLDKCVLCRIYQKDDKSFARSTRQRDDGSHRLVAASMEDDNEGDDGFVMEDHMESPGGFIINPNTGTTDHRFITGQKSPLQFHHESGGLPMDFHQHSNLLPQFNGQDQFQPMSFGHHSNARLRTPEPPMLPPYNDDDWAGILNSDKEFIFQSPYFDQFPPPPHSYPSTTTGLRYDPFLEGILQVPNSSSRNVVSPVTVHSSSMPPPAHNYHHVNVHSISPLLGNSNPSFYMNDYKKSSPK